MFRIAIRASELFAAAFLLNLLWEALHVPLYHGGYFLPEDATALSVWFWPTLLYAATIDALLILGIYGAIALLTRDPFWLSKGRMPEWTLTAFLGLLIAFFVELQGLSAGKWGYGPSMPIVPVLQVGLSPFVQLALTGLAAFFLVRRFGTKA